MSLYTNLSTEISRPRDLYIRPGVNLNRFEISNRFYKLFRLHGNFTMVNLDISNPFQKLFRLHGDFTTATFKTIARF